MIKLANCDRCFLPVPDGQECYCRPEGFPNNEQQARGELEAIVMAMNVMCTSVKVSKGFDQYKEISRAVTERINGLEDLKDVLSLIGFWKSAGWLRIKTARPDYKKREYIQSCLDQHPFGEASMRRLAAYHQVDEDFSKIIKRGAITAWLAAVVECEGVIAQWLIGKKKRADLREKYKDDPMLRMLLDSGIPIEILELGGN